MADYEIGYGKPPASRRFKAGVSGNPKGRPKRKPNPFVETINKILNERIKYRERDRTKVASAEELNLRVLIDRAVSGDLEAAEIVLKIRESAERCGSTRVERIVIGDWMPDYRGQSGEQKGQDLEANRQWDAGPGGPSGTAQE